MDSIGIETFTLFSGITILLLGFSSFAYAYKVRADRSSPVSKSAIFTFVGLGGLALGLLVFLLGFIPYAVNTF